jgi:hypothetical protein
MAQKLSKTEIERLIRLSESSRSCLSEEYNRLRHRLDVPARLHASLKTHPTGWLVGTLVSGFAISRFIRRRPEKRAVVPRGLPITLLGLAFAAAKPALKIWLGSQLKRYISSPRNSTGAGRSLQ